MSEGGIIPSPARAALRARNGDDAILSRSTSDSWNRCDETGVNVMIAIFCDVCQFSAKKLAFFTKSNAMMKFT
jgi:hypothetical protein